MSDFMGLPIEMRNRIYEHALSDLLKAPPQPYTVLQSDFRTYCALRRISKQVDTEVKTVFDLHIAPNITFYTESVPRVYDLLAASYNNPAMKDARFRICFNVEVGGSDKTAPTKLYGTTCFIAMQHGYTQRGDQDWTGYDIGQLRHTTGITHYWSVNPNGPTTTTQASGYKVFTYHNIGKGVKSTTYEVDELVAKSTAVRGIGQVDVLEGRLADLVMDTDDHIDRMRGKYLEAAKRAAEAERSEEGGA